VSRSLYNWIADCATTSCICNKREVFTEYIPIHNDIPIYGVGNTTTHAKGQGTVIIETTQDGKVHKLALKNVLHVPNNRHNIISLGRWAHAGGTFKGGLKITLISPSSVPIVTGSMMNNNLYKLTFNYANKNNNVQNTNVQISFSTQSHALTWEAWHRHFGHVSYNGLAKLHTQNLVDGFTVDMDSPKPECPACIAAKQSEKPFGQLTKKASKAGELTHADL
jgi:GAG-pre-integrase domain